jgi:glycosyltransferase involved in cell wall biosynthesis
VLAGQTDSAALNAAVPCRPTKHYCSVMQKPQIAVLIPCYNEEKAIASVVRDFRAALPDAQIYVYDNNSSDRTAEIARAAGAIVRTEIQQGKGHVVRRMFRDVEADFYLMVDGDDTYDASVAGQLVAGDGRTA